METVRVTRRPCALVAVRVTAHNVREVAAWCQGLVPIGNDQVILLLRPHDVQQIHPGMWVVHSSDDGYSAHSDAEFHRLYEIEQG